MSEVLKKRRKEEKKSFGFLLPLGLVCSFDLLFLQMADTVEEQFHEAVYDGDASEVLSLLRDHPGINVNWTDEYQWTALHAEGSSC